MPVIEKDFLGGLMIREIAVFLLLCSVSAVRAETVDLASAAAGCTRASLQSAVDKYLDALKKGSPSSMPLATPAKYIENRKEIPFGQGIWQTPLNPDFHRSVFDTEACESFTEIIHTSSSHPYVIGTHLTVSNGKISEVDNLVSDENDWLFNADNYMKYSPKEKWDILPPAQRSSRQTLLNMANAYYDLFYDRSSFDKVPWGIPCVRIEGGMYTNEKNDPNPSCAGAAPKQGDAGGAPKLGGVRLVDRRFVVDEEMGTVVGLAVFEKSGLPDSHMFRLENGKLRYVHTITVCPNGCPRIGPASKAKPKPDAPQ